MPGDVAEVRLALLGERPPPRLRERLERAP
jgi:hypothetical protein